MYAERSTAAAPERGRPEPAAIAVSVRGRSILALVVAPCPPLADWLAGLDRLLARTPDLFADRPVVADLAALDLGDGWPSTPVKALDALAARNLRLIGVEGIDPDLLLNSPWSALPSALRGREGPHEAAPGKAAPGKAKARSLVIDRPVRSGQTIACESGDVTILGAVASGAEVIAGGSIHVYGPLRGRAIAGVGGDERARIFCRALEAELVAVGGVWRMAESWAGSGGEALAGRPVQIERRGRALNISVLE